MPISRNADNSFTVLNSNENAIKSEPRNRECTNGNSRPICQQ